MRYCIFNINQCFWFSFCNILLHLFFISEVLSQDKPNLYFRNISEKDGLSSNNVSAIAEDKNGFIWIGGNTGLDKYDGTKFTHYKKGNPTIEILDNVVHDLYIDSNNTLFVEHLNGFSATNLDYKNIKYVMEGVQSPFATYTKTTAIIHDNAEVFKMESKLNKAGKPISILSSKIKANLGTTYRLIYEYKDGYLAINVDTIFFLNKQFQTQKIIQLPVKSHIQELLFAKGCAYVMSWNSPLFKLDLQTWQFYRIGGTKSKNYVVYNGCQWKFQNKEYFVFTGCGDGLILYDKNTDILYEYKFDKGICINNVFVDSRNNLWITSTTNGIYIVSNIQSSFTSIKLPHQYKEPSYVYNIWKKPDNIIVSTRYSSGSFLFDLEWNFKKHIGYFPQYLNTKYNTNVLDIYDVVEKDNFYYCSTDLGLNKLDINKGSMDFILQNNDVANVRNIVPLNDSIWLVRTVQKGVIKFNHRKNKIIKNYTIRNQKGRKLYLGFLAKTKKSILLCSENGIFKYNPMLDSFQLFDIPALNYKSIRRVIDGINNDLWIATSVGLYRYEYSTKLTSPRITQELDSDIDYLFLHNNGHLWYSNSTGIIFYDTKTKIQKRFDNSLGIFSNVDEHSVFKLMDNEILACVVDIIYKIDEKEFINFKENNEIYFESLTENKIECIEKVKKNIITLTPGIKNPFITFSSPSFLASNNIIYSYKISNAVNWTVLEQSQILLTSLSCGLHSIHVKGFNKITGEETPIKNLTIEILPYFYQTWWFKLIIMSLLVFLGFYLYKIRVRNITEKLQQRKKYEQLIAQTEMSALKAQMNPHFIFNCINSIDALIQTNDKYNATLYLNKFAKLIRNILESSKQNLVSFSKDMDTMKLYLELEELRNDGKFKIAFDIDPKLEYSNYKVPPLIIQPYIENAIIHGLRNKKLNDGILQISAKLNNDMIEYEIRDNGIGRLSASQYNQAKELSYGMQLSSDRIRLFNNDGKDNIEIIDLYEGNEATGTLIKVKLKTQ